MDDGIQADKPEPCPEPADGIQREGPVPPWEQPDFFRLSLTPRRGKILRWVGYILDLLFSLAVLFFFGRRGADVLRDRYPHPPDREADGR
jgi:hypothetical protein